MLIGSTFLFVKIKHNHFSASGSGPSSSAQENSMKNSSQNTYFNIINEPIAQPKTEEINNNETTKKAQPEKNEETTSNILKIADKRKKKEIKKENKKTDSKNIAKNKETTNKNFNKATNEKTELNKSVKFDKTKNNLKGNEHTNEKGFGNSNAKGTGAGDKGKEDSAIASAISEIQAKIMQYWFPPEEFAARNDIAIDIELNLDDKGNIISYKLLNPQNTYEYKCVAASVFRVLNDSRVFPLQLPKIKNKTFNNIVLHFCPRDII